MHLVLQELLLQLHAEQLLFACFFVRGAVRQQCLLLGLQSLQFQA